MSRTVNGRMRKKPVREAFTEQSPYYRNGKRKSFPRSYDDTDIAYRSTPEYLRQLMNTSINSARSLTRTHSASDMTSRNLGNPKYKAQEDYYDEVQALKKELKSFKDDNSNLRARVRRLEEDNARKTKEIDGFYDTTKDGGDSRRASISSSIPINNVVMNLKQRLFKLESQLKQKETAIEEMKNDPRWTKGTELEIQNRALFSEIEKQKIERLNFIQNDYMAAIDEEKKNAVRKLEGEKRELKIENENLKKKLADRSEQLSARQREESIERKIHHLKEKCHAYENEIEQMKDDFKDMRRDRDKYRDKFDTIKEDFEEIKRQRDQYRQKLDRINDFDGERYQTGRSSPTSKHHDEHQIIRPSSEEPWKKHHRPTTPTRKPNEDIHTHSSQNLHQKHSASDDFFDQDNDVKQNTKHGGMVSPRTSQQKLGSKIDHLGSGTIRDKEHAFKIVQTALRGHINRNGLDKTSRARHNSDDEDTISSPSRKYESERRREDYLNHSKSNYRDNNDKIGWNNRDSTSKLHRTPSPPNDNFRASSPHTGSKQNLYKDGYKLGSANRLPIDDRELHRPHSPATDNYRASSPHTGSKQNLYKDGYKLGSANRLPIDDREPHRPHSPATDNYRASSPHTSSKQNLYKDGYKLAYGNRLPIDDREPHRMPTSSMDNYRPVSPRDTASRQPVLTDKHKYVSTNRDLSSKSPPNDLSSRKNPYNSKQSLKSLSHDDDDDVSGF